MIQLKLEDVNRKYSQTWVKCNDDSQSKYFRSKFIEKYGGEFIKENRREYTWREIPKPVVTRRKFIFEDPEGKIHFVDNMYDFCKKRDLNRAPMYEMIAGKRKQYKKYKFVGEIPWQL
jgi:hypothetical protein